MKSDKLLIVVDPQNDFITGTLPVPDAPKAMNELALYLLHNAHDYACKVVSCDWHPAGHCSFATAGGPWPVHCMQHSEGAAIYPPLMDALYATDGPVIVITKGESPDKDEYSLFQTADGKGKIDQIMHKYGIHDIDICGLAGDICVLNTYKDAASLYGAANVHVLPQFSPSIDGGAKLLAQIQTSK